MVVAVAVAVAVVELVSGSLAVFSPSITTTTGGGKGVVTRGTSFYNQKQSPAIGMRRAQWFGVDAWTGHRVAAPRYSTKLPVP